MPFTFLKPSTPFCDCAYPERTLWLSMTVTVGRGFRPVLRRPSATSLRKKTRALSILSTCGNDNIPSRAVDNTVAASYTDIRCKQDMLRP